MSMTKDRQVKISDSHNPYPFHGHLHLLGARAIVATSTFALEILLAFAELLLIQRAQVAIVALEL